MRRRIVYFINENVAHWIARHLPKNIQYWATINVWAHATTGKYSNCEAPAVTVVDALKRWDIA
jgi:hypothetical protein